MLLVKDHAMLARCTTHKNIVQPITAQVSRCNPRGMPRKFVRQQRLFTKIIEGRFLPVVLNSPLTAHLTEKRVGFYS
jgi:hypothetical protein